MKRTLLRGLGVVAFALASAFLFFFTGLFAAAPAAQAQARKPLLAKNPQPTLQVQLLRHGTLLLSANDARLLIDPMLAPAGSLPPIPLTSNRVKNPLVELPCDEAELLGAFDAVLVTHLHPDHFDDAAQARISKDTTLFCQPADRGAFEAMGFRHVQAIESEVDWHGLKLTRHAVNHGVEPWLREQMGPSSAFVISSSTSAVMLTGDAVLDDELRALVSKLKPAQLIANAGGAQMLFGSPITLTPPALQALAELSPTTHLHAVHMDAINHCASRRSELAAFVHAHKLEQRISVPEDGERWEL